MAMTITPEQRNGIIRDVQRFYADEFDENISEFRTGELVDLMVKLIGTSTYNQAVQDTRKWMLDRLDDLDGEVTAD